MDNEIIISNKNANPNGITRAGSVYLYDSDINLIKRLDGENPNDELGYVLSAINHKILVACRNYINLNEIKIWMYMYDSNGNLLKRINAGELGFYPSPIKIVTTDKNIFFGMAESYPNYGKVNIYDADGNIIKELVAKSTTGNYPDGYLGSSIFVTGNKLIVGANGATVNGKSLVGAVNIYNFLP
jgi:hypothetical protein